MKNERNCYNKLKTKIIVVPHYSGSEKSSKVFKDILISQIRKNIEKAG